LDTGEPLQLEKYCYKQPEYFFQMAWGDTIRVGCGIAYNCTLNSLPGELLAVIVCDYDPPYVSTIGNQDLFR
jgi:hypothetical protein